MSRVVVSEGYRSVLSLYDTQEAIALIKKTFEKSLSNALNLKRVSAPLFVEGASGLNDDLNGVERRSALRCAKPARRRRWCIRWPSGSAWRCTITASRWARGCIPI